MRIGNVRHRHSARVGRERRRQVSPLSHGCATRCAHCLHHAVNPSRRARSDQGKQAAGQTRSGQRPGLAGVFMRSQVHNGAYWRALAVACSSHLRPHPDRVDSLSQPKELRRNATASDRACLIDAAESWSDATLRRYACCPPIVTSLTRLRRPSSRRSRSMSRTFFARPASNPGRSLTRADR